MSENNQNIENTANIKRYIYQIKPTYSSNQIEFKPIGYIYQGEKIKNELIEIDKSIFEGKEYTKDRFNISDEIYIQFYKYNYLDYELVTSKSYHILLGSIMYNRKLIIGNLCNFMLDFDITDDTTNIKSFNDLVSSKLIGNIKLRLFLDERNEEFDVEIKNLNGAIKKIIDITMSENMKNIFNSELAKRDAERIKRLGEIDYKIPTKVTNFNDLIKKYKENGDINKTLDDHNYLN